MKASPFDLSGKVAIVTGGNGGIGLGMALGLARAGANIVIAGRNEAKSKAAAAEIEQTGAKALALKVDVMDKKSVTGMIDAALSAFGQLDVLINNAGINIRGPAETLDLNDWHQVIDTNLTSAFLCAQAAYPIMKKSGGGKIINVGSMMSIFGAGFLPAYAASKGGIVQFTKAIASSWAQDNIQANAILPGWIDTDLTRKGRAHVPTLHDAVMARTPAKRWGTPEDLAGTAVFLSSSASDFLTGISIPVDGGYSAQG